MDIEEMIRREYPLIHTQYVMYSIGKPDTVCIEEFIVLGGLFKGVEWGSVSEEVIKNRFDKVENSFKQH